MIVAGCCARQAGRDVPWGGDTVQEETGGWRQQEPSQPDHQPHQQLKLRQQLDEDVLGGVDVDEEEDDEEDNNDKGEG